MDVSGCCDGICGACCPLGSADGKRGMLGSITGIPQLCAQSPPHSWSQRFWFAITGAPRLLMASDQSSQSFLTEGSLSKPAIELIPLTAKGIPHCRIIFPVSVNNFSTAFPDSYASDLLISPCLVFFFLFMTLIAALWLCTMVRLGCLRI